MKVSTSTVHSTKWESCQTIPEQLNLVTVKEELLNDTATASFKYMKNPFYKHKVDFLKKLSSEEEKAT